MINSQIFKNFIYTFNPPKDYFDYLVNESLDISQIGTKKFEFRNKYKGKHSVKIVLENFPDDLYFSKNNQIVWKLKFKIDFYVKDSLVFSSTKNLMEPFVGKDSGYFILIYECPKDLPINQKIICNVTIIEPDYIFTNKYGPVRFCINKMSDK